MASLRDWAVSKLRDLKFEGDADALAAYVEALIENNKTYEDGDPAKLKVQACAELTDFLGEAGAQVFVAALIKHRTGAPPTPPAPPAAPAATAPKEGPPQERGPNRSRDRSRERSRERGRRSNSRDGRRLPVRRDERRPERMRDERVRDRNGRDARDDMNARDVRDGGRDRRDMRDERMRDRPVRGAGRGMDLRDQLNNRRRNAGPQGGPQKRPRDESVGRGPGSKLARHDPMPAGGPIPPPPGAPTFPPVPPGGMPGGMPGAPPGFPPFPFMPPEMVKAMTGGPPPDPTFLASFFAAASAARGRGGAGGPGMARGGRGGRGARGGRGRGGGAGGAGRANTTLVLQNAPHDKLNLLAITEYFQKFGRVVNVRLVPPTKPSRAFIDFASRGEAAAAMRSVDAVMGNRHIKLHWARVGEADGDSATTTTPAVGPDGLPVPAPEELKPVDHAAELAEKKERIQRARAAELADRAAKAEAKKSAMAEQRTLIAQLEGASDAEKKAGLVRLKELGTIIEEADPPKRKQPPPAAATEPAWKRTRGGFQQRPKRANYVLDNRPKVVRIGGAKRGISADAAAAIFRDTERAESVGDGWILHFSTRAAAESAVRAAKVLKRGFGDGARAEIVEGGLGAAPAASAAPPFPTAADPVQ